MITAKPLINEFKFKVGSYFAGKGIGLNFNTFLFFNSQSHNATIHRRPDTRFFWWETTDTRVPEPAAHYHRRGNSHSYGDLLWYDGPYQRPHLHNGLLHAKHFLKKGNAPAESVIDSITFVNYLYRRQVLKDTNIHHLRLLHLLGKLSLFIFLPLWLYMDSFAVFRHTAIVSRVPYSAQMSNIWSSE